MVRRVPRVGFQSLTMGMYCTVCLACQREQHSADNLASQRAFWMVVSWKATVTHMGGLPEQQARRLLSLYWHIPIPVRYIRAFRIGQHPLTMPPGSAGLSNLRQNLHGQKTKRRNRRKRSRRNNSRIFSSGLGKFRVRRVRLRRLALYGVWGCARCARA